MIGPIIYFLGSLVTLVCSFQLLRGYLRVRQRLLLWGGLCFAGLTASNALLFLDLVIVQQVDLYIWRLSTAAGAMLVLLYGLILDSE
jgi:hypothetical protein